jgi:rare lipoprotein A
MSFSLISKLKGIALFSCSALLLTGCSQIELASHMYKGMGSDSNYARTTSSNTANAGNFKVGKPYTIMGETYVPRETYEYVETGIASWYGPGFHGNKTASGERYDKYEMTAAHRTLQMPSLVRVTNLDNGRSVIVRVNDRGPFAKGRIIDVSKRAAELLDMIGTGTAKVRVEMLSAESRAIAEAARRGQSTKGVEVAMNKTGRLPDHIQSSSAVMSDVQKEELPDFIASSVQTPQGEVQGHINQGVFYPDPIVTRTPPSGAHSIFVQAGAFGSEENAIRLSQKLSSIANTKIEPVAYNGRTLYKVRLGPLQNVRDADSVLNRVLASGHSNAIIVVQ